jgi:hypothetical protein
MKRHTGRGAIATGLRRHHAQCARELEVDRPLELAGPRYARMSSEQADAAVELLAGLLVAAADRRGRGICIATDRAGRSGRTTRKRRPA